MSNSFAPPAPKPAVAPSTSFDPDSIAEAGAAGNGAGLPLFLKGGLLDTPGDQHEKQAERVASKVTQNRTTAPVNGGAASSIPGAGTPLPSDVRGRIEGVLGADLGDVRLRHGAEESRATGALHARAFTHKNEIWLRNPADSSNTELLAHESAHVVQQAGPEGHSSVPAIQRDPDPAPITSPSQLPPVNGPSGTAGQAETSGAQAQAATTDVANVCTPAAAVAPEPAAMVLPRTRLQAGRNPAAPGGAQPGAPEAGGPAGPGGAGGPQPADGAPQADGAGGAGPQANGGTPDGAGGADPAAAGGDSSVAALDTGTVALLDEELAEHQRWAGALGHVGGASSLERAEFVAEAAGGGFLTGVASGAAMGLGMGLIGRAAARYIPIPGIGGVLGGAMAVYGMAHRDWSATGATIGKFGEGNDNLRDAGEQHRRGCRSDRRRFQHAERDQRNCRYPADRGLRSNGCCGNCGHRHPWRDRHAGADPA